MFEHFSFVKTKSVNFEEMFRTWIRIHFHPERIQDPHQNEIDLKALV